LYENTKDPKQPKWSSERTKPEISCSLIQTILQGYGNQEYGIGIKRDIDQWNRLESPKIDPCTYGQLIFNKEAKNTQEGKNSIFSKCTEILDSHI